MSKVSNLHCMQLPSLRDRWDSKDKEPHNGPHSDDANIYTDLTGHGTESWKKWGTVPIVEQKLTEQITCLMLMKLHTLRAIYAHGMTSWASGLSHLFTVAGSPSAPMTLSILAPLCLERFPNVWKPSSTQQSTATTWGEGQVILFFQWEDAMDVWIEVLNTAARHS